MALIITDAIPMIPVWSTCAGSPLALLPFHPAYETLLLVMSDVLSQLPGNHTNTKTYIHRDSRSVMVFPHERHMK